MNHDDKMKKIARMVFAARDKAQEAVDLLNEIASSEDWKAFDEDPRKEIIVRRTAKKAHEARRAAARAIALLDDGGPCDEMCQYL